MVGEGYGSGVGEGWRVEGGRVLGDGYGKRTGKGSVYRRLEGWGSGEVKMVGRRMRGKRG